MGVAAEPHAAPACCALFMRGVEHPASCTRAHLPFAERPPCPAFAVAGRCPRGDACWFPHVLPPPAAPADGCSRLLLSAPKCALARVTAAAEAALPGSLLSASYRADETRGGERAVLLTPPRGVDVAACLSALSPEMLARLSRCMWLKERAESVQEVAAAAALQAPTLLRARVWPHWAGADVRAALEEARLALQPLGAGAAAASHVLDIALIGGCWHWHVWSVDEAAAAPLLARAGRTHAPSVPCRAFDKLAELIASHPHLLPRLDASACCVDIGAAPGGWTKALCDAGAGRVWAIDPAPLSGLSLPLPSAITHLAMRGEAALAAVAEGLRVAAADGSQLRLICCDANIHPPAAAALALSFAALANDDDETLTLVVSEKRFAAGRAAHAEDCARAEALFVAAGFSRLERLHLFANGSAERTLVARR